MANGFVYGSNVNQMDRLVTDSFYGGMISVDQTGSLLFQDMTPVQFNSTFDVVAGAGAASETTMGGIYTARTLKSIGSKAVIQRAWKNSFSVSQGESKFDNYLNIQKMVMAMGYGYAYMGDDVKAEVLKNAFVASATWGVTINGTANALFGNTQTVGDTGTTQDTLLTGDLSETTLDTAFDLLEAMVNHDGLPYNHAPKYIVGSRYSRKSAMQLADSPMSPEDANTAINVYTRDNLEWLEWSKLSIASGTLADTNNDTRAELKDNWFLLLDKPYLGLYSLESIRPKLHIEPFDQTTGGRTYYFDAVLAAGATSTLMGVGRYA